jgi:hypothetical protein
MQLINSILDLISRIFLEFGLDLIIVVFIVVAVQGVKAWFDISKTVIFILLLTLGVGACVFNLFVVNFETKNILRMAFGYPIAAVGLYSFWKKYGKMVREIIKGLFQKFLDKFKKKKDE